MMTIRHVALAVLAPLVTSCSINIGSESSRNEPARTDTLTVERDKSEFLRVDINMKAGELRLAGGATKFLEGSATYTRDAWKPVLKYASVAGRGNLTIEQPNA